MFGLGDLLYPQPCLGCSRLARGGLCRECIASMERLGGPVCGLCGFPVSVARLSCGQCRGRDFCFDWARQALPFGSTVRLAVHRFKYLSERSLAKPLSLLLAELVGPLQADAITWVPADPRRMRKRGFDHAKLLAQMVGRQIALPVRQTLKRSPSTPQVALEPHLRRKNLTETFTARETTSDRVIVVDDVFTTGATVSEAARALKSAGAAWVGALCIARSLPPERKGNL